MICWTFGRGRLSFFNLVQQIMLPSYPAYNFKYCVCRRIFTHPDSAFLLSLLQWPKTFQTMFASSAWPVCILCIPCCLYIFCIWRQNMVKTDYLKIKRDINYIYLYLILLVFLFQDMFKLIAGLKRKFLKNKIWMTWGKTRCYAMWTIFAAICTFDYMINIKYYNTLHLWSFCKIK